jgi:hypothetical protein
LSLFDPISGIIAYPSTLEKKNVVVEVMLISARNK